MYCPICGFEVQTKMVTDDDLYPDQGRDSTNLHEAHWCSNCEEYVEGTNERSVSDTIAAIEQERGIELSTADMLDAYEDFLDHVVKPDPEEFKKFVEERIDSQVTF